MFGVHVLAGVKNEDINCFLRMFFSTYSTYKMYLTGSVIDLFVCLTRDSILPVWNSLHCALSCTVYCNSPCLFVCLFVCGSALLQPARSVCVASERFFSEFIFVVGYCVGRDSLQRICSTVRTENIQYSLIRGTLHRRRYSRFTDNYRLVVIVYRYNYSVFLYLLPPSTQRLQQCNVKHGDL